MRMIDVISVSCPQCGERNQFSDWHWQERVNALKTKPEDEVTLRCSACYQTSPARAWQRLHEQEAIKRAGFVTPRMQKEQRA